MVVLQYGADKATATADIFVDFVPDVIVLKFLTMYDASTAGPPLTTIVSDLVNGPLTAVPFSTASYEQQNVIFKNTRPINGMFTFNLDGNGSGVHDGELSIALQIMFARYK
jgi:hypothetical protein